MNEDAIARLLAEMRYWKTLLLVDLTWVWICVEHHRWRRWRGIVSLFPETRCLGFSWGEHDITDYRGMP